jgi:hypothetical protein
MENSPSKVPRTSGVIETPAEEVRKEACRMKQMAIDKPLLCSIAGQEIE